MNTPSGLTPAKILLFGEYSVLVNSSALVIPYFKKYGQLSFPTDYERTIRTKVESNLSLKNFFGYCEKLQSTSEIISKLDLERFRNDLKEGLYFKSSIPQQYGLGSSGSLTAAIFKRYALSKPSNIYNIKKALAQLESHFHGKSSGFDSLVCYIERPLLINELEIKMLDSNIDQKLDDFGAFLVDTRQTNPTHNFVNEFLLKFNTDQAFRSRIEETYNTLVNQTIELFINSEKGPFFKTIKDLVLQQYFLFSHLYPEPFLQIAKESSETGLFYIKLCGSGGGGYLLGFTKNMKDSEAYFKKKNFQMIKLSSSISPSKF